MSGVSKLSNESTSEGVKFNDCIKGKDSEIEEEGDDKVPNVVYALPPPEDPKLTTKGNTKPDITKSEVKMYYAYWRS